MVTEMNGHMGEYSSNGVQEKLHVINQALMFQQDEK